MATNIEIHKISEIKGKNPVLVLGFPGIGLVGSVAGSQMVDSLGMEFVGYVTSPTFAPLAAIHDYIPLPPVRIHYSSKYNVVLLLSEMSIPTSTISDLADKVFEFAHTIDASYVVSLGGISLKDEENAVYLVASDKKISKNLLAKKLVKPIKEGATTGVIGILLAKGAIEKFPIVSLLGEATEEGLDPKASSNVLRVLSQMLNISINTNMLDKEAKEVSRAVKESVIKSKIRRVDESTPGSMYG